MKIKEPSAKQQLIWYINHLADELDEQITTCQLITNYMHPARYQQYIGLPKMWREVLRTLVASATELAQKLESEMEGGEESANG